MFILLFDIAVTLLVILVTALGSAAFLSIAFVEGTATSRAGGAVVARRVFAVSMMTSVLLFAVPLLFLLGIYSEEFARPALSVTLSAAVLWNAVLMPILVLRLACARFVKACAPQSMRGTGLVAWALAAAVVGLAWALVLLSGSLAGRGASSGTSNASSMSTSFACMFTSSDVRVLRRSGMLQPAAAAGTEGGVTTSPAVDDANSASSGSGSVSQPKPESEPSASRDGAAAASPPSPSSSASASNPNDDAAQSSSSSQAAQLAQLQRTACSGLRDAVLARLALLGACCVAALSGFAAISTPVDNMFPFLSRNGVRDAQATLTRLQRRLQAVLRRWGSVSGECARLSLQLKRLLLLLAQPSASSDARAGSGGGGGGGPTMPPPLHGAGDVGQLQVRPDGGGGGDGASGWFSRVGAFLSSATGRGGSGAGSVSDQQSREILEQRLRALLVQIAGYLLEGLVLGFELGSQDFALVLFVEQGHLNLMRPVSTFIQK